MPSVQNTPTDNSSSPQLQDILSTFTSLTDPIAINDALLVIDRALQDPLMSGALLQSLNSPSPRIHALGLAQVDKISKEDISVLRSTLESDIFKTTVEGIASESISIAERSKQTLLKICSTEERLAAVIDFEGSVYLIQDLANSRNSVVRMRMIEALTELAGRSHESLDALQKTSLLDSLKDGLTSADILTRFNIIEILSEFGATEAGSEFLDQSGILTLIANVVENEADQDSLGVNAIAKLYGKLGASDKVDFISLDMKYQILAQLEKLMVGDDDFEPDELLKTESMASFGLVGGNVQNIEWVSQSHCAQVFIDLLTSLPRDLKVACHVGLGGDDTAGTLFVWRSDRNAEFTHAQKVAKYEVIEAILGTAEAVKKNSNIAILTTEQISRLDLVRRQGPFYRRATATVAVQDMAA
ncbi:26S proteasome non-ATPase regulatory subunit 5 [Entomortierella chlamydospora]|uniref:26S proteasome non-ATPase regulatory subunit 5 n=1 Tax=Entomortierella chlamydospora TaxID=101097 RepID=A0A9P6N208_9FUNG|nr:26S proteasome non-ATPase regulatory subunit 5 [Entomortierella chlamydospora]